MKRNGLRWVGWLAVVAASGLGEAAPLARSLRPYTTCQPAGGPAIVQVLQLPSASHTRTAMTLLGAKDVELVDGVRVMFSYPDTDFFANVKIEELPAAKYEQEKGDITSEFEKILASDDKVSRNYGLKPMLAGYGITGLDRGKLEGGTLGIYLLFDDKTHVVMTVYFLNGEPGRTKFTTIEEYRALRDDFLHNYTACVRKAQAAPAAAAHPAAKTGR